METLKALVLLVCLLTSSSIFAQTAPDFTLTDTNGVEHTLYDDLDAGFTVIISFFTTDCGGCWQVYQTGEIQNKYNEHGPNGDNTWRIYFIEIDSSTDMQDLLGNTSSSAGDWLTGNPIPVIESAVTAAAFGAQFSTYMMICPEDKSIMNGINPMNAEPPAAMCPTWTGGPIGGGGGSGTTFQGSVAFEGYQGSGGMSTDLADNGLIPMSQPFNVAPFNYSGTETIGTMASNTVDWVLVELRDTNDESNSIDRKAAMVDVDGNLMDVDGNPGVSFDNAPPGDYFVVLHHSGHVSVMSSSTISLPNASPYSFMDSNGSVMGTSQLKLSNGAMVMRAGDYNNNGTVNFSDFILWLQNNNVLDAYAGYDADGNGTINFVDFINWLGNNNHLRYPGI